MKTNLSRCSNQSPCHRLLSRTAHSQIQTHQPTQRCDRDFLPIAAMDGRGGQQHKVQTETHLRILRHVLASLLLEHAGKVGQCAFGDVIATQMRVATCPFNTFKDDSCEHSLSSSCLPMKSISQVDMLDDKVNVTHRRTHARARAHKAHTKAEHAPVATTSKSPSSSVRRVRSHVAPPK
jgi:hypothetical protein